ncbi:zinc-dependent metalloprotease [Flavobacteriaceae bacterium]|nr:zinc-dependent metalloprotease [Flavobacteriaceae bacterium]MDC1491928.1 zinc-dependent metalloprotease [Flavobacteriaceae bacterium]
MNNLLQLITFLIFSTSFSQSILDKKLDKYEGFFDFYYDVSTDKIYLEVENLNSEFLYINSLATGIGSNDIGLDRGQLGNERLVSFQKAGNKLLLIQPNLSFRANTDNKAEEKSIKQAFAKSVIYGFKILETNNKKYLIDFTSFLMQDKHGVAERLKRSKQGVYKIDISKSAIELDRTKSFPKNSEFEALLTFSGNPTGKLITSGVSPDPSLVSVVQHHSFIELPDNKYIPRIFDPRSGALAISFMDYATPVEEEITKKYITRHRLEKIDPTLEYSEAKEPIVYYLDPGTPEPVRSALIEGASWWNQAYEAIGFKNAFQVKILPEDADPMDCRYNVIQWVHRSTRGWSYGSSVVDPRTGEIIKGHVSLGSLRIRQDFLIAQALLSKPFINDDNNEPMLNMAIARIKQLSAHEVGHTIGFAHNFSASTNSRSSVMDYPHPLIKLTDGEIDLSDAYAVGIGEWDKVSVAYSYSVFNSENEQKLLNSIIDNAYNKGLRFITDSDARANSGAHLNAHLWDNGNDVTKGLEDIMLVRNKAINHFSKFNIKSFETYSKLEDVFVPLYFLHRYQTEGVVKLIGGLDYNYATRDDNQTVVNDLSFDKQSKALSTLLSTLKVENLAIPKSKLNLFPPRAYNYPRTRESFKSMTGVSFDPFSAVSTASEMSLSLLLNPERMNRVVVQSSLSKNELHNMDLTYLLNSITKNTFKVQHEINNDYLFEVQQVINNNYLKFLLNLASNQNSFFQVKAEAKKEIGNIAELLSSKKYNKNKYKSEYLNTIRKFNSKPELFELNSSPKIPDGSPIGSTVCNLIN